MTAYTLSANTFFDNTVSRTGWDTFSLAWFDLTFRTDTRVCNWAPAWWVGSIATMTWSSTVWWNVIIDWTSVRWMKFNSWTGNVPVIWTSITQSWVTSSYLLWVWSSLNSLPVSPGSAMPTTWWLKFREVSWSFTTWSLTWIWASAEESDRVWWIEIVCDQWALHGFPWLSKLTINGSYFNLWTTTWAEQTVQIPSNSTDAYVPWVEIETDIAWVYELYPSIPSTHFNATNLPNDIRGKFVMFNSSGQVVIWSGWVWYIPPSWRNIRVPNVFLRQCTSATRWTNAFPSATFNTRPRFSYVQWWVFDASYCLSDWNFSIASANQISLKNSIVFDSVQYTSTPNAYVLKDWWNGCSWFNVSSVIFNLCQWGWVYENWKAVKLDNTNFVPVVQVLSSWWNFTNCTSIQVAFNRASISWNHWYWFSTLEPIVMESCKQINCFLSWNISWGIIRNHDHTDRLVGTTLTSEEWNAISLSWTLWCLVEWYSVWFNWLISNVHQRWSIIYYTGSSNVTVRNIWTRTSPVNAGTVNPMNYLIRSNWWSKNMTFKRIYASPIANRMCIDSPNDQKVIMENCFWWYTWTYWNVSKNWEYRSISWVSSTWNSSVYWVHFIDTFTSDTTGEITLNYNQPTAETSSYYTVVSGSPKFTQAWSISMRNVWDEVIFEDNVFRLWHTWMRNVTPLIWWSVTLTNFEFRYQIDTWSWWNWTWKDITAVNLITETIDYTVWVKFKFKIKTLIANNQAPTSIKVYTTTTPTAQGWWLYPLTTATYTIKWLIAWSQVCAFTGTPWDSSFQIASNDATWTSYTFTHSVGWTAWYFTVIKQWYKSILIELTYPETNSEILLQPIADPVFIS